MLFIYRPLLRSAFVSLAIALFVFPASVSADPIFKINNGASQVIDKFDICRKVTNATGADLMIPTGTLAEWQSFIDSGLAGVTLTNIDNACIRTQDSFEAPASGRPTGWLTEMFHIGSNGPLAVSADWATDGTQSVKWATTGAEGDMHKDFDLTNIGTIVLAAHVTACGRGSTATIKMTIDSTQGRSSTGEITYDVSALTGNQTIYIKIRSDGCAGYADNLLLYSK